MTGGIYLIDGGGALVELTEQAYDSEDLLQELLAKYPNLLAGDQIDQATPRRWLLVSREMGVPGEEGGGGRWSLDHLFLDQDGIPTLVEVKRSTDTRLRREVVGQMLDYAANAVVYWPAETIRAHFHTTCENGRADPDEVIRACFGPDLDEDAYWQSVKTNLQAGRVRMLFVADVIPEELRRIIEFLNVQMDPAEVLAVEIRQFVGQNLKTLVPRVIGQTAEAERRKKPAPRAARLWDEISFFSALEEDGKEFADLARRLMDWAQSRGAEIIWGQGAIMGSMYASFTHRGKGCRLFAVYTSGGGKSRPSTEVNFSLWAVTPPFDDVAKRRQLLDQLNAIPGVALSSDQLTRRPCIPLSVLLQDDALTRYTGVLESYMDGVCHA